METSHLTLPSELPSPPKSLWRLLLSRSIRSELSRLRCHGHSLLLSSYLHKISRKETSDCSACGHPLQDLNHLLLDCRASEPLRKIYLWLLSLYSRSMVQTLGCGPTVGSPRSSSAPPSLGRGRVVPPPQSSTDANLFRNASHHHGKIVTRLVDFFNGNLGVVHSLSNHTLFVRCNH